MEVCDFDILNIVDKFEILFNIEYASVTVVVESITSVTIITKSIIMFIDI